MTLPRRLYVAQCCPLPHSSSSGLAQSSHHDFPHRWQVQHQSIHTISPSHIMVSGPGRDTRAAIVTGQEIPPWKLRLHN
jgi:hypothetical protein